MRVSDDEPMVTWLARRPRSAAVRAKAWQKAFYTALGLFCLAIAVVALGLASAAIYFVTHP